MYLSLLLLMLIRFVAMCLQWSHLPGRRGKDRHVLPGTATRDILACPVPLAWGSCGLLSNSGGQPIAIDPDSACLYPVVEFSEEAVPASCAQRERREMLTKLVTILVQGHPLPREAIAPSCGEPRGKSCIAPAMAGGCGHSVKFHPSTREPAISRRKTRRRSPRGLPSSVGNRWKFPGEEYRRMQSEWRASSGDARLRAFDLADE
eukprot:7023952-Pyramimonas_sp.AAC.1